MLSSLKSQGELNSYPHRLLLYSLMAAGTKECLSLSVWQGRERGATHCCTPPDSHEGEDGLAVDTEDSQQLPLLCFLQQGVQPHTNHQAPSSPVNVFVPADSHRHIK